MLTWPLFQQQVDTQTTWHAAAGPNAPPELAPCCQKSNIRSPRALLQLAVTLTQNGNGHITYMGDLGEEPPPPAPYCLNCETHKTERGELGGHTVPPTTFRAANVPSNTLCFTLQWRVHPPLRPGVRTERGNLPVVPTTSSEPVCVV